jgi:tetrahydromethanopterin S-methyltransferase subunit D
MSFGLGLVLYILGSVLIGICLWCIPASGGAPAAPAGDQHGHGGH